MMHIKFRNFTEMAKNMATNLFPKPRPPVFCISVYFCEETKNVPICNTSMVFTIHHIVTVRQRSGKGDVFSHVCPSVILCRGSPRYIIPALPQPPSVKGPGPPLCARPHLPRTCSHLFIM